MPDFRYYNPSDESKSCVVRTLTLLSGKPYATVKSELTALAASAGCSTYNDFAVFETYLAALGFARTDAYSGCTVGALSLPEGRFAVVCTNGAGFFHMLPVIGGTVYDRRNDSGTLSVVSVYTEQAKHETP